MRTGWNNPQTVNYYHLSRGSDRAMKIPKLPDQITKPINRKTVWLFGFGVILWSLFVVAINDRFFRIDEIIVYPDGSREYRVNPK